MMTRDQRRKVWVLFAVFFVVSAVLSEVVAPGQREYLRAARAVPAGDYRGEDVARSVVANTSFQALLPTLLGVREVLASLMWVRADDYFHRGEYRPILQMVHEITAIDPHQLDVYATGAWHMAYNFMDKRLIADGVKFLQEGCKNNDSVYDLYFELGYMHTDKTKDFAAARAAYLEATQRATSTGKKDPPSYVRHQLAHAMERMGDIDACVEQWKVNHAKAEELLKEGEASMEPAGPNQDASRHNLYMTQRRRNERLAAWAERDGRRDEALQLWQGNVALAQDWLRQTPHYQQIEQDLAHAEQQVERLKAGKLNPVQPADLTPHFTVERISPKHLKISGSIPTLNLARVAIRFQDKDYDQRAADFNTKMANCTLEWDSTPVRQQRFSWILNLDRDPADMDRRPEEIYPLKADQYELTVSMDPRLQAAFIQDRYGWNGEGLTAQPEFLKTVPEKTGIVGGKRYPLRLVSKTITLTRDDVVGTGQKLLYKTP